jgi:predicted ester cyclase
MEHDRRELETFYRRYNRCCNEHRFAMLGEFVHDNVKVNGEASDLARYIAGLTSVVDAFPDHHWDLRRLLVDGSWLSGHFVDTGTHTGTFLGVAPTGRSITIQEFATYRISDGKIAEVWGTADNVSLLEQLTAPQ